MIAYSNGILNREARIADLQKITGGRMQDQAIVGFQEAVQFYKKNQFKKSFLKLIQISNLVSKDENYLFLMSQVQNELKDYSAREKTLKVLCEVADKQRYQLLYMSQLLENCQYNSALDIGLNLQAEVLCETDRNELYKMLSQIYIHENDFEGLAEVVKLYEKVDLKTDQYYFSLSLLSLNQSNEILALECLRSAVLQNQNFDQAWVALALLHDKMGDQDLSIANLEKAIDVNPLNASALKHFSIKSVQRGCVDKAVERINFYLQVHNFDQEMTAQFADLMKFKNMDDVVQRESDKLTYYFGQQISL